jgi:hypothetical protein
MTAGFFNLLLTGVFEMTQADVDLLEQYARQELGVSGKPLPPEGSREWVDMFLEWAKYQFTLNKGVRK